MVDIIFPLLIGGGAMVGTYYAQETLGITSADDAWERLLDRIMPADSTPAVDPDVACKMLLRGLAWAVVAGSVAVLIGASPTVMGAGAFLFSFAPAVMRAINAGVAAKRGTADLPNDAELAVDDDFDTETAEKDGGLAADDLGDHAIPEMTIMPDWMTCPITRSLGTAKAHALMSLAQNGISRGSFCAATGKPQSDYPQLLQNWSDLGLMERSGGRCVLTYYGQAKIAQIITHIEKM
jgi:hypothetical protein